jgi:hypothetical protein
MGAKLARLGGHSVGVDLADGSRTQRPVRSGW